MRTRSTVTWLGLLCIMVWPAPANADWQFTKWGMSEGDVVRASGGLAKAISAKSDSTTGLTATLSMPYQAGPFQFDATFYFDTLHKLQDVHLQLIQGEPVALIGSLNSKYGEPASSHRDAISEIDVWRTQSDQIAYAGVGMYVTVDYMPRLDAANRGL